MLEVAAPEPRTVCAADGRVTGFYEFGDPDGTPVLAMHGTPGSGAGFAWADAAGRERGVRVIAPDRPAIGDSDGWPDRRHVLVGDYPPLLAGFADALGLDAFALLGYSGGAPYALAAAHALAARVTATAIVSGAGQVGVWASTDDFDSTDKWLTRAALRMPTLARTALALSVRFARVAPKTSLRIAKFEMADRDRAIMDDFVEAPAAVAVFTQSCRRTAIGVVDDYAAQGRPWGFDVEQIDVPVRCFHAPTDPLVPIEHSEELVRRVPGATLTHWEGEGHLAIVTHIGEVLDALAPA